MAHRLISDLDAGIRPHWQPRRTLDARSVSRTASQTEVNLALAPRIDAPPDLVDDSDDDEMSPFYVHGGRSLGGVRAFEAPRILHITGGETIPDLLEHSDDDEMPALVADDSDDDEMPALVADDPSIRGTRHSPAWGCAKPGRQG